MMPARRRFDFGRWLPALVPLGLGLAFAALGRPLRALILLGLAALMALLVLAGVPVARWVEVAVVKVVRGLADVVLGGVFLLVAVPTWGWRRVRGRQPLEGSPGWRATPSGGDPAALGGHEAVSGATISTRLLAAVGVVVVLLAADYGIGWTWDRAYPTGDPVVADQPAVATGSPADASATTTTLLPDPRAGAAPMAASSWAAQYFEDLRGQQFGYWPFTGDRPEDYATRYINIDDWVRRSWEPTDAAGAPSVWFFGGSAMFGEGQRDEHTIPSEVARLAAAEGLPIQVRNYGQRGWVHMQEALLFEQQLAIKARPEFSVFYDGPNDLQAAAMFRDAVPTDLHADEYALILRNKQIDSSQIAPSEASDDVDLIETYAKHSAVRKVVRWLTSQPAGASPSETAAPSRSSMPAQDGGSSSVRNSDGNIIWGTVDDGEQGIDIYGRARAISTFVGQQAGVETTYFWQPVATTQDAVGYAREHLPKGVVDLSDVFGDEADDVYIDTTHTNEAGARMVAEAMWANLKPQVEAWYEANR